MYLTYLRISKRTQQHHRACRGDSPSLARIVAKRDTLVRWRSQCPAMSNCSRCGFYVSAANKTVYPLTYRTRANLNLCRYTFRADRFGFSWYHSHYSAQYAAGLLGPMIIHGPTHVDYDIDLGPVFITDCTSFHLTKFCSV